MSVKFSLLSRDESPVDPDLAAQYADHPDIDPLTRVHLALDAGFRDPDFTQAEAAALANMGTRRLRYLLAGEDTNYRIEIDRRRMTRARELLAETNFLVSAVAKLCGYRNPSAFCKRFKERYELSPAAFRVGLGRPRRAGGPTGATKNSTARAEARKGGYQGPWGARNGWGPGGRRVFLTEYENAVRQARAFGGLPRHADISWPEKNRIRWKKRRRGAAD